MAHLYSISVIAPESVKSHPLVEPLLPPPPLLLRLLGAGAGAGSLLLRLLLLDSRDPGAGSGASPARLPTIKNSDISMVDLAMVTIGALLNQ